MSEFFEIQTFRIVHILTHTRFVPLTFKNYKNESNNKFSKGDDDSDGITIDIFVF